MASAKFYTSIVVSYFRGQGLAITWHMSYIVQDIHRFSYNCSTLPLQYYNNLTKYIPLPILVYLRAEIGFGVIGMPICLPHKHVSCFILEPAVCVCVICFGFLCVYVICCCLLDRLYQLPSALPPLCRSLWTGG